MWRIKNTLYSIIVFIRQFMEKGQCSTLVARYRNFYKILAAHRTKSRYYIVILYYGITLYPTISTMCYENVDMRKHYEESTFPICFSTNWIFADESGWFLWSRRPFRGLLRNKITSDDIRRILYFQFPCGHRNEIAFWQRWSTSWIEYFLFTAKSICSKSIVSCDLDS